MHSCDLSELGFVSSDLLNNFFHFIISSSALRVSSFSIDVNAFMSSTLLVSITSRTLCAAFSPQHVKITPKTSNDGGRDLTSFPYCKDTFTKFLNTNSLQNFLTVLSWKEYKVRKCDFYANEKNRIFI